MRVGACGITGGTNRSFAKTEGAYERVSPFSGSLVEQRGRYDSGQVSPEKFVFDFEFANTLLQLFRPAGLTQPFVEIFGTGADCASAATSRADHRQAEASLPALNGSHPSSEICGNVFPAA